MHAACDIEVGISSNRIVQANESNFQTLFLKKTT